MIFTTFEASSSVSFVAAPNLSTGTLAMIVALASFVICGLFLLMAIPVEMPGPLAVQAAGTAAPAPVGMARAAGGGYGPKTDAALSKAYVAGGPNERKPDPAVSGRIPYERDNTIRFLTTEQISAFRADGHYTRVMNGAAEFFCPWSISRVEKAIETASFVRTHRSYLVNLRHVAGFKRDGDKAFCFLKGDREIKIPVSRSRVSDVQKALGLT